MENAKIKNLSAIPKNESVSLSWELSEKVVKVEVLQKANHWPSPSDFLCQEPSQLTSYEATGLTNDVIYHYIVKVTFPDGSIAFEKIIATPKAAFIKTETLEEKEAEIEKPKVPTIVKEKEVTISPLLEKEVNTPEIDDLKIVEENAVVELPKIEYEIRKVKRKKKEMYFFEITMKKSGTIQIPLFLVVKENLIPIRLKGKGVRQLMTIKNANFQNNIFHEKITVECKGQATDRFIFRVFPKELNQVEIKNNTKRMML